MVASNFVAWSRSHLTKSSNISARPSSKVPGPLDLFGLLVALMWMILLLVAERSVVIAADDRQFVSEVVPRDVMKLQRERVVVAAERHSADHLSPRRSSALCLRRSRFSSSLFMVNPLK